MKLSSVFLDSSVILAGLASASGGSAKIFEAGRLKKLNLIVSELVLEEVKNHLDKLKISLVRYREFKSCQFLRIVETPPTGVVIKFSSLTTDPNDAHVLAAAVLSTADFLVSLDQKHILTRRVRTFLRPVKVFSPRQFWKFVIRSY